MRFLMTLNMPAYEGSLVQQITVDIDEAKSLMDLCQMMNRDEFIVGHQWYRRKRPYNQVSEWEDRGLVIINTAHIGKVVEFLNLDNDGPEEGYVNTVRTGGPRGPIRPSGRNF